MRQVGYLVFTLATGCSVIVGNTGLDVLELDGGSPTYPPGITVLAGARAIPQSGNSQGHDNVAIAIDEANVYWSAGPNTNFHEPSNPVQILRVPKAGGDTVTLLSTPGYVSAIALDDSYVYAAFQETGIHDGGAAFLGEPGLLIRVPKAGGAMETIAGAGGMAQVWDVAVDGDYVYWSEGNQGGSIKRAPKAGGAATPVVAANVGSLPMAFTVEPDESRVYWSDSSGAVYAVSL